MTARTSLIDGFDLLYWKKIPIKMKMDLRGLQTAKFKKVKK